MVLNKPALLFFLIYLLNLTNQWLNKLSENVSFFWITALVLFCLFFHYFIVLYEILFFLEKIPSDIVPIECFEDQLYYIRPEMLHSVCIARSIRFIGGLTKYHTRKKICRNIRKKIYFRFEQKEGFFKINSERVFHGNFHGNLNESKVQKLSSICIAKCVYIGLALYWI